MLKVNEEKLIADYKGLIEKKESNIDEIESSARAYGVSRGYTEEKLERFIEFCKENEDGGLCEEDEELLEILSEYIINVDDEEEESEEEPEKADELDPTDAASLRDAIINGLSTN